MQGKLKILIVEDEVLISERLKQILMSLNYSIIGICNSLEAVIQFDFTNQPDIVLLDIRMNGVNEGVEVAKILNDRMIPFVFVTSFTDKSTLQEAILQGPLGYLVKPFSKVEIKQLLESLHPQIQSAFLNFQSNNKFTKIPIQKIKWINSSNVYVEIYFGDNKHLERIKLNNVEEMLPKDIFIRIHQSYIINKRFVEKLDSKGVWIEGKNFPISKKYKSVTSLLFD